MPGYGYCDRYFSTLSSFNLPTTLCFNLLQLTFRAVLLVFALTFLNEVSIQCIKFRSYEFPLSNQRFGVLSSELPLPISSLSCCAVLQLKPWFLCFLPVDSILKELLDFLPDDCLNFDIPEYRTQTSAFLLCRPEGRKELVLVSTKKLSPLPQF